MAAKLCPVWVGYLLASPLRKLFVNPQKILSPYVEKGMKVLDIGCAMGFFSLPLAQMVGSKGKVICAGLSNIIETLTRRFANDVAAINACLRVDVIGPSPLFAVVASPFSPK